MQSILDLGPAPQCPPSFNLTDYVLFHGQADDAKTALRLITADGEDRLSYGALRRRVLAYAHGFRLAGIGAGDLVMLRIGHKIDFPICFLALAAIDAVPIPMSDQLTPTEVAKLIDIVGPKAIVQDGELAPTAHPVQFSLGDIREWNTLDPISPTLGDPNRAGYIIFTSGTSGTPKAVLHAHRAIWARRMMWQGWYDLHPDDHMFHAGAFNWSFTLGTGLLDPWACGATSVVAKSINLSRLSNLLPRANPTIFAAAPGVFRRLLRDTPNLHLSRLRHGLAAGEALPKHIAQGWTAATQAPVCEAFGMTECSTFLSATPQSPEHLRPQVGRHIAIMADKAPAHFAQSGAIAVHKSDQGLMLGYVEGQKTTLPLTGDWFVTGDIGRMTPEGTVEFQSRTSDMMNAGGFRVSPREVEDILAQAEGVQEIAVAEVPVGNGTTIIAAFVALDENMTTRAAKDMAQTHLARYKQPRQFVVVKALPRTANGKLNRKDLLNIWNTTHGKT